LVFLGFFFIAFYFVFSGWKPELLCKSKVLSIKYIVIS
jgi:hypothetical protein